MATIQISDRARKQIAHYAEPGSVVRLTVKAGGCAGMVYDAEIDTEKRESEVIVLADDELTVVADRVSLPLLEGLVVDYSDDLISAGFRFTNSNNETSCGCGASFALAGFPQLADKGTPCHE
jgi:iron-sulfur cluster assembly protein